METHYPVIIIGGGQAGLSMSFCLKEKGIAHLVFEKNRLAESWRSKRWDSFCLVTPNWQCALPGFDYAGDDPKGFMVKDQIVEYIESYARSFDPPLKEGVNVWRMRRNSSGVFEITTDIGDFTADQVVVATGGYQTSHLPRMAERFPSSITQLHSSNYKNAAALPPGEVLVVGTGQSGCQIAEDLHLAGRRVHLCVGGAPRTARRYRGKDVVEWLADMGYYDMPIHEHPKKDMVRSKANHYVTGRDGGRDIDLRRFALEGMQLYGRLKEVTGSTLSFADDLKQNLDQADNVSESIKTTIDKFIASKGIEAPQEDRYIPLWQPEDRPATLDYSQSGITSITSIIWSMGYGTDYRWIEIPIFDGKGYPNHDRGVTSVPGVYFIGLPWQYTWGSGRFSGVAQDARFLANCIESRHATPKVAAGQILNMWALGS
ncbi:putative flavoprotein involved in K+ transport [Prosthecobacter fusiformis]|uniref:Putative flavoprotein involved in K+ transport n=1 Tax=Prosthecobacter fusiformis TaxID=48464 RepID=A0A4R7RZ66_9BACT|nr:MSMEG_0569 family flavin-dependent oxidoreductase [Prosthecobacter fusiformis]TDU71212.1 putative flavoprotein involved in K+ transport [Prosthecobacter fusiformis]